MGNICSSPRIPTSDYSDFCPLRIATLYADIDESINKKKKIETMVEYFLRPYHGYNLDVLCIQGIRNYKILKEIVSAFKHRIEKYNDDSHIGYKKAIYLEYYPDIECTDKPNENDLYWSTSESEGDAEYCDKLIVSRHGILQSADVQIGTDKRAKFYRDKHSDVSLMINNNDSDEISSIYKYIQIVNLNVDGIFVSVYNVEIDSDSIGISNTKERRHQIQEIKHIVERNRKKSTNPETRQFVHGDSTYVATNRDIHIVAGMFHINELKNGVIGSEYTKTITTLNALDVHRWVGALRKDNSHTDTNVRFTKDTFTFLISKNLSSTQDVASRSQKLFEEHKLVIINSNVNRHLVDMNQFTNYPEDSIFMMYRPNIELFVDTLSPRSDPKQNIRNIKNDPTRFMDQMQKAVLTERYAKGQKPHPVFGTALNNAQKNQYHPISQKLINPKDMNKKPVLNPLLNPLLKRSLDLPIYRINLKDNYVDQETDKSKILIDDPNLKQSSNVKSAIDSKLLFVNNDIEHKEINQSGQKTTAQQKQTNSKPIHKSDNNMNDVAVTFKKVVNIDSTSNKVNKHNTNNLDFESDDDSSDDDANKEIQDMVDLHITKMSTQ